MEKVELANLPMIEVAYQILRENSEPASIYEVIEKVFAIKGIDKEDYETASQLYLDITLSANFSYHGDNLWTIKDGNFERWENETYVSDSIDDEIEVDELELEDFIIPEETEEEVVASDDEDEDFNDEPEVEFDDTPVTSTDEDDDVEINFDDLDEDDYNEIMDDYEDMYDE